MKLAKISDLIFFKTLLILAIWSSNKDMNFEMLLVLIGTIVYYLEDLFVVILILGFGLLRLLMVLYISSIFFKEILGKLFLIFKISLMLKDKACTYNYLFLLLDLPIEFLSLFWKNFNFFKTFLLGLDGIGGRILETSTFFFLPIFDILAFLLEFLLGFFRVNFKVIF